MQQHNSKFQGDDWIFDDGNYENLQKIVRINNILFQNNTETAKKNIAQKSCSSFAIGEVYIPKMGQNKTLYNNGKVKGI